MSIQAKVTPDSMVIHQGNIHQGNLQQGLAGASETEPPEDAVSDAGLTVETVGGGVVLTDDSEELDAIAFGYTKLLEESNGVLQDLKQVINVSTLSMTDKDRMDVVDDCYASMRRYRNLVNYYTNRNIAVSFLRARKKNDLDRVLKLYGNDTSKYW